MADDELEISVLASDEELLQGVSAQDGKDGDVTGSIVIERISNITSEHTATITYAAFDEAGNVAKASRTLRYTDYTGPRFGQTKALVFSDSTSPDVLDYMTAQDMLDGDLSDRVKGTLVSDATSLNYVGLHQVEFRVSNSMGDTVHIKLPVEVYEAGTYNASVELTDYLVYVKKGADFKAEDYLETLTVGSINYSLKVENTDLDIEVDIADPVDADVPGVYSVAYTVTMDRYVGYTRLNVVVEEQ